MVTGVPLGGRNTCSDALQTCTDMAPARTLTTSACVAGDYLSSKGVEGSYVYVIGEPALMSMLSERAGVRPIGGPDDAGKSKRTLQSEGHSGSRARGNGRSQLGSLLGTL